MGRPFAGASADPLSFSPHEMRPEIEDELIAPANGKPSRSGIVAEEFDFADSVITTVVSSAKIEALIASALAGKLPRDRALKYYEPAKLNPRHISVIMMRAVGYRQNRIAELSGFDQERVSIILNHPDSRSILAAILTANAKTAVNIAATVQAHAPKMLEIVRGVAENRVEKTHDRLKAAFKWLDMYGDTQKKVDDSEKPLALTDESANRLSEALREASEATEVSFVVVGEGSGDTSKDSSSLDPVSLPTGAPDSLESLHGEVEAVLCRLDRPA